MVVNWHRDLCIYPGAAFCKLFEQKHRIRRRETVGNRRPSVRCSLQITDANRSPGEVRDNERSRHDSRPRVRASCSTSVPANARKVSVTWDYDEGRRAEDKGRRWTVGRSSRDRVTAAVIPGDLPRQNKRELQQQIRGWSTSVQKAGEKIINRRGEKTDNCV